MIDFIKILIPAIYLNHIKQLTFLKFYDPNRHVDSEGKPIYNNQSNSKSIALRAKYNYLTIDITKKGNILLYGSLHKFWTNGINHNDFYLSEIFEALLKIESELKIDLSQCLVQNLEISINLVNLPLSSKDILSGMLGTLVQRSKKGFVNFKDMYIKNRLGFYRPIFESSQYFDSPGQRYSHHA